MTGRVGDGTSADGTPTEPTADETSPEPTADGTSPEPTADETSAEPREAADEPTDPAAGIADPPGVPATPRTRAKSALLWGVVGALSFLVIAQAYLLLGGTVPIRYPGLFPLAAVVGAVAAVSTFLVEHRLRAKRRV